MSTTGTVTRMAGMGSARSVPALSSSSTLLSWRRASPNPASTMRFWAVRLSMGTISAPLSPTRARPRSRAEAYGSREEPGRTGNVIQRSPARARASTRRPRVSRWWAEQTGIMGSSWMCVDTSSGCGSASYRRPRVASPRRTSSLTSRLSAVRTRRSIRMEFAKASKLLGQRGTGEGADHGQGDGALIRAAQRAYRIQAIADGGEERLRVGKKRPARLGEDGAAPDPLEEWRPQLVLEEMEAAADRGLRQVQGGRGAGEAAASHDGHERLDLVELHGAHQHS